MAVQVILEFTDAQWDLIKARSSFFVPLDTDGLPLTHEGDMLQADLALFLKNGVSATVAEQIRREQQSQADPFDV